VLDSTPRCESDNGRPGSGSATTFEVDTPTECVAAALKVGHCPDMRGSRSSGTSPVTKKMRGNVLESPGAALYSASHCRLSRQL